MARECGICKQSPRESDQMSEPVRLHEDDVAGTDIEPGLYQCCKDCHDHYLPIIHARLMANPPPDAMGTGKQQVPPLEAFGGNWLM